MTKTKSTQKKNALITGATGLVGGELLRLLLSEPDYKSIIAVGRNNTGIIHPKLEEHEMDLSELESFKPDHKIDEVFCTLGTTIKAAGSQDRFYKVDHDFVLASARLAAKIKAGKFLVVSALGASCDSGVFYNRVKGEMERDIKKEKIPCIHVFRPSLLLGKRKEFRMSEKVFQSILPLFSLSGAFKKYRPVEAAAVALSMVECAKKNETGFHIHENDTI